MIFEIGLSKVELDKFTHKKRDWDKWFMYQIQKQDNEYQKHLKIWKINGQAGWDDQIKSGIYVISSEVEEGHMYT